MHFPCFMVYLRVFRKYWYLLPYSILGVHIHVLICLSLRLAASHKISAGSTHHKASSLLESTCFRLLPVQPKISRLKVSTNSVPVIYWSQNIDICRCLAAICGRQIEYPMFRGNFYVQSECAVFFNENFICNFRRAMARGWSASQKCQMENLKVDPTSHSSLEKSLLTATNVRITATSVRSRLLIY
jgi:hypothetical protein